MLLPHPTHTRVIQASWTRCREHGLEHHSAPRFDALSGTLLAQLLEQREALVQTTLREVLPYYENLLGNSHCLIRLADEQGRLLKAWGDQRFIEAGQRPGFQPGAGWLEALGGTNAIGTALACQQAVHIEHDEHFLKANRFMTGSAAPIVDARRHLVAVLDVSSDSYLPPSHTLGLVKMMSQTVENRLMLEAFDSQHFQLYFNTGLNNLGSQWAGLLLFDDTGTVLAANRRADSLLGLDLPGVNVQTLFRTSLASLLEHPAEEPFGLLAGGRNRLQCLLKKPQPRPLAAVPAAIRDPQVTKILEQGRRLLEKDIPLLIRGETGTGKEVLVKALHAASSRAQQALVAVNCAAIPTELVESELFGYDKGAFTGASLKGNTGLIRKADKGVLFLDEIGDMPLATQARLLRVLQERCVQPLGSGEPIAVDLRVICATHTDLRARVREGSFREDLYYRLAGMTLTLPPLRERLDKRELIQQIWRECREPQQIAGFSEVVLEAMLAHPWPGNLRQLRGVVQVALAMADSDLVELEHLPEDFFEDLALPAPVPATSLAKVTDLGELLESADGNISRLARRLGVSRNTLYKRLRAQGHGV